MRGLPVTRLEIEKMISLREKGFSLPEIRKTLVRGYGTIFRYTKDARVSAKYTSILRNKRGGSKRLAQEKWAKSQEQANILLNNPLSPEQRLCILAGLYWGEGNKREFNLINSDPLLIKCFISCLFDLGITKNQLKINLRLYEDIDSTEAIKYWTDLLSIDSAIIGKIDTLKGKKKGKLKFGMCRVRVAKSAPYFKLVISLINRIKDCFSCPRSSMDRTDAS